MREKKWWSIIIPSISLQFIETFPIDPIKENYVRQVKNVIFSQVLPTPLRYKAKLVAYSEDVLTGLLDLHPSVTETEPFVAFAAGNTFLDGSIPLAHRYGGHQVNKIWSCSFIVLRSWDPLDTYLKHQFCFLPFHHWRQGRSYEGGGNTFYLVYIDELITFLP